MHVLLIDLLEVLSNLGLLIIKNKTVINWVLLEVNIIDDVGSLGSPISNHRFIAELETDNLLELRLTVRSLLDLENPVKTSLGGHELENVVNGKSNSKLTLEGRSFETFPDPQAIIWKLNSMVHIKEAGRATKLLQLCLSEGLLDDNIEEVLAH